MTDDRQPVLELGDAARERQRSGSAAAAASAAARAARRRAGSGRARPDRVSIRFRPSWISAARGMSGTREIIRLMLCAIDLIGVSELLISCDSTRTMRCQACCSCSRSARLRSAKTSSWCGLPSRRNVERRSSRRPLSGPNGRSISRGVSPVEVVGEPQLAARRARAARGAGLSEQPLAGRVDQHQLLVHVEREDRDVDRAHDARAAAPVDSTASVRCRCSVSPSALISFITRSTALPGSRAGAADRVVPLAQRAEQVRLRGRARACTIWYADAAAADPDDEDDRRQRPADLEAVVLAPDEVEQRERRRQAGEQREQEHRRARGCGGRRVRRAAVRGLFTDAILLQPAVERAAAHAELLAPPAGRRRRAAPGPSR